MSFLRFGLCLAVLAVALASNETPKTNLNFLRRSRLSEKQNIKALIEGLERKPKNQQIDDLNQKLDSALDYLNKLIDFNEVNWLQLSDILDHKFKWGLVMNGKISLTEGWLGGFSSLVRAGDVSFFNEGDYTVFDFPIAYQTVNYNYKYKARLVAVNYKGKTMGDITGAQFTARVQVHRSTVEAKLRSLEFFGPWKISVDIDGIVHEVLNIFESVIGELMQSQLPSKMYSTTLQIVDKLIVIWNQ